jgi:hypothetical protein
MNFVQVTRGRRLCYELTNTFFQGAINHQIRMRSAADPLAAK